MAAAPKTPRLLEARGAITSVGLLLVLGLAAAAYLAWMWVPVYVLHYEVVQVVRNFGNQAVKNHDDAQLVEAMVSKVRSLDQVVEEGPDGRRQARPTVDLRPQDVTWERVEPASLHVAFDYVREVALPFVDRKLERTMTVDLTMDVSPPNWGSSR
jgi:hypothetical protein